MTNAAEDTFFQIRKQIRKAVTLSFNYSHRMSKEFGVTGPQIGMLKFIGHHTKDSLSISEIANGVGSHIASVEGMVKRLHRLKLVRKRRSRKDRRVVEVFLTEKAEQIIREAPLGIMGKLFCGLQELPDEEIRQIGKMVTRVAELIDNTDEKKVSKIGF